MRKIFSFAMVLMVLTVALGISAGSVNAAPASRWISKSLPPRLVLHSPYFDGLSEGEQVPAEMFVDSNFKGLYCIATSNPGYVACEFPKDLAGETATLYLQAGGKTIIFWVTIPNERTPQYT